jgi:ATP synthase mitochondrial F1 complex assembly factor 1
MKQSSIIIKFFRRKSSRALTQRLFSSSGFSLFSPKRLHEILKLDSLKGETKDRVKEIWTSCANHKNNQLLCGTLDPVLDTCIRARGLQCPLFIYPVFRSDESFFMMLSQFQENVFVVTYLEDYKKNPSNARPWLQLTLYDELVNEKDIGLYRADFIPELTATESRKVVEMIVQAYTDDEAFKLVSTFNTNPQRFNFDEFLKFFKSSCRRS